MLASLQNLVDGLTLGTVATTLVDVAIVYYLIYRLLLTIRGTRAAQMIVGMVLLGTAYLIAERMQLSTVSWLLDNFIAYFIILIIVVFQQDIRRALGRIGQNVLPFGRKQETTQIVDEVVAATAQLARARIGAIVVFEREAALEEFVDDATRIDAVLSRQLLVALFVPSKDNELHDGAVVIGKSHRSSCRARSCRCRARRISAPSSARATARRSGSPRTPTRWRSWCPRSAARSRSASRARSPATSSR